jgi:hypothetical protein
LEKAIRQEAEPPRGPFRGSPGGGQHDQQNGDVGGRDIAIDGITYIIPSQEGAKLKIDPSHNCQKFII